MKKLIALVLALTLALSLFAACGDKAAASSTAASGSASSGAVASEEKHEPVTVKWMHHFAEEARIKWCEDIAAKTTEKYPWITVEIEVQPYDKYIATLKTKIQSDDAPDIYDVQSRAHIEDFVSAGYCADMTGQPFTENIMDAGLDAGRIDGKIYSIVQDLGGASVFYNKDIFAANKLEVPTTYSAWMKTLETLKAAGITPIAAGYQEVWALLVDTWADFVPALFEDNVNWAIDKMAGTSTFAGDKEFEDAMKRIYERTRYTQSDAFGSDWNKACELVATGEAAMVVGGFFALDAIQSKNPDVKIGSFAMPRSEDPKEAMMPLGQAGGFIVHESPNKEAAFKVIEVMLSEEMASQYQTIAKTISTVKGIDGNLEPALQDIVAIEADGRTLSTSALANTFTGEFQKAYCTELVKFLMGEGETAALAATLDTEFAKLR